MANLSISFISIFFFILNFPFLTSPNIKTNHLLVSLGNLLFLHFCSFFYKLFNNAKKNFIAPFNGWGSTASRLELLRAGSLEKMGEKHILFCQSYTFESIPAFAVWIPFPRDISCNLMGNSVSKKVYV